MEGRTNRVGGADVAAPEQETTADELEIRRKAKAEAKAKSRSLHCVAR
jgi:hypothetical protein